MSYWQNKVVMITGVCGLIGAPLAKMLRDNGANVIGVDTDYPGCLRHYKLHSDQHVDILEFGGRYDLPPYINEEMPVHRLDITDRDMVRIAVARSNPDVIFHMAAVSHVEKSRSLGAVTIDVNVGGVLNVLEAARVQGARVIVPSSNHVYGHQDAAPTTEDAPLRQMDTYSVSKIMADYLSRAYAHNYQTDVVVVRNTNCYGPFDPHEDHIVPSTVFSLLRGNPPVIRSEGTVKKSFLYVDDVCRSYMIAAKYGQSGKAYNVADNQSYSAKDMVDMIRDIMPEGRSVPHVEVLCEQSDQSDEYLDSSRIRELGWEPHETLRSGLEKAIDGLRQLQTESVPSIP
jgi:nucleoside-diphosphate-sugar epimerase